MLEIFFAFLLSLRCGRSYWQAKSHRLKFVFEPLWISLWEPLSTSSPPSYKNKNGKWQTRMVVVVIFRTQVDVSSVSLFCQNQYETTSAVINPVLFNKMDPFFPEKKHIRWLRNSFQRIFGTSPLLNQCYHSFPLGKRVLIISAK